MRFRVDEIAFDSPAGLEDGTSYCFRADGPRTELTVEFELPGGGATPAAELLDDMCGQMKTHFQGDFGVDDQGELELMGQAVPYRHFHIMDGGQPKQGFTVAANIGNGVHEGDYVKIGWLLDVDAGAVRGIVDPVLASWARADRPAPGPTPAGSTRRQAAIWAFDLPAQFSGPRSFTWEDVDAELRVGVTVHPLERFEQAGGPREPDLEAHVAELLARGRAQVEREDVPIIHGAMLRLVTKDDYDDHWWSCRARQAYEVGNPVRMRHVEVAADGPLDAQEQLRRVVDELLASISAGGRR
ncbi:hypothetical protein PPSIR1_17105 [Plesiocystis pacifica SIR-1]|uniref:Uncharacterized protein n=1 Tax=Plesiocystis pacifica SIR-1 TaxID=391625 RepID=A6GIA1_9BACT|nr:hypothetical protein [Plesiocystis pacifica]EDM74403.1 hypothetical protein PPSIR1_17105 [Plesiocystis pacifica SIR-1]